MFFWQLKKDFEEDKQAAVARTMTNMQREIEKARKLQEDKCKEQYMEEMKKLAAKHKEVISQTKKKQWVSTEIVILEFEASCKKSYLVCLCLLYIIVESIIDLFIVQLVQPRIIMFPFFFFFFVIYFPLMIDVTESNVVAGAKWQE